MSLLAPLGAFRWVGQWLGRVLPLAQPGVYVEVGVRRHQDRWLTAALASQGWQGVAWPASPAVAQAWQQARPKDTVLESAQALIDWFAARDTRRTCLLVLAELPEGWLASGQPFGPDPACAPDWVVVASPQAGKPQAPAAQDRLQALGYELASFDGLHHLWIHAGRAHWAALAAPVSPAAGEVFLADPLEPLQRSEQQALRAELAALQAHCQGLEHERALLLGSLSWRLTAPLRAGLAQLRRLKARLRTGRAAWPAGPAAPARPAAARLLPPSGSVPLAWPLGALQAEQLPPPPEATATDARVFWRLVGHVHGHYSLAVVNRNLALALEARFPGRVRLVPHDGQAHALQADRLPAGQAQRLMALTQTPEPAVGAGQGTVVSIVHHYPPLWDEAPADTRIALFFWEESRVPDALLQHLARFDAVWVSSPSVRAALRNSGFAKPVALVPLGVDHLPLPAQLPALAPAPVLRVLHVSSGFPRKGIDLLLQAWFEQFRASDGVELLIKTFPNPHQTVAAELAAWQARVPDAAPVRLDEQPLSESELPALYRSAHCLVLPSRGEGFCLPAAEAMAQGCLVLVGGQGGQRGFAHEAVAGLVPGQWGRARSHLAEADSLWYEPDPRVLGLQLRELINGVRLNDPGWLAQRERAWQQARQLSWARAAQAAASALQAVAGPQAPRSDPWLALLSPWACRCGIAEYTQALWQALEAPPRTQVWCDLRTAQAGQQGAVSWRPCWALQDEAGVLAALAEIAAARPAVLWVQHQPALFRLSVPVCEALAGLERQGIRVVLELHAVPVLLRGHRLEPPAASALRELSRVVVHQMDDLNALLRLGLGDRLLQLPHHAPPPAPRWPEAERARRRAALGLDPSALVVASFGIALPHKGLATVARALGLLQARLARPVQWLALHATPDAASRQVMDEARQTVAARGLAGALVADNGWLGAREVIERLSLADAVVFPYEHTQESASGAVTLGMASGQPVITSALAIFEDVRPATRCLPDTSPEALVAELLRVWGDASLREALAARQTEWLAQRQTGVLAQRLLGLMQGLSRDPVLPLSPLPQRPVGQPGCLWVDVSAIVVSDSRTGIQRVVRNVLSAWQAEPPWGWRVVPVAAREHEGYCVAQDTRMGDTLLRAGMPVQAAPGDLFVGLDLSAHLFPAMETQLQVWKARGVGIAYVVYDLIPLRHPEWLPDFIAQAFEHWLPAIARQADLLVGISAAVAQDLRDWLREPRQAAGRVPFMPAVDHFRLGADLDGQPAPAEATPPALQALAAAMAQQPTLLMVGTLEPRKGYAQALAAFEALWAQGETLNLVIVGKPGWGVEALIEQLRQHPQAGQRLWWLEQASDAELEWLYRHCQGLLAASLAEGFGLPLIEAAQRGLPVLARNLPVFREVAGDSARYFEASTPHELAQALRDWLALACRGQLPRPVAQAPSWRDSARDLARALRPVARP